MNYIQQQYPTDTGPHACNVCAEQFAVSSGLLLHKLTSHSPNNISALLIDLLENEVLNSSDNDYCYSFVFTTTYYRYPKTIIKFEQILEEDPCEIRDAMYFEADPFEDSKPIIEDLQHPESPEPTIKETPYNANSIRVNSHKVRKMCPICYRRFHPQGLYRHIRMIHNSKYSISKGRAKLVRTMDCNTEIPTIPLEDIFVETQPDVAVLPETQLKQTPESRLRKKCLICGDRFHPKGLYRHMHTVHSVKYSVRGVRLPSIKTIYLTPDESNDELGTSVPTADKEFVDPLQKEVSILPEEITTSSSSHKLRKMCPICYRRFHPQGLYRHLKVMHNTVYSAASGRSKNRTLTVSNVETSLVARDVADADEIKPEVDTAASILASKEKLKRSHKLRKLCPICFVQLHPQGLYRHLLTVHNTRYSVVKGKINLKLTKAEESSTEKSPIIEKRRKCPFCNRFYYKHGLSRHLQNAHGQSKDELEAMYKRFRAQPLTLNAMSIEPQTVVEASNKPQFICPMCDEKLECQSSFRHHLRQIHQFPISTTDKFLNNPTQYRKILTGNLRPCPLCGCGLHPQSITRHLRSVHKSSKEEVLALSRLMRVEQKRREAQLRKSRQKINDPGDSFKNSVL